jgi:uncharacterized protein YlxW (UPF0749 family)
MTESSRRAPFHRRSCQMPPAKQKMRTIRVSLLALVFSVVTSASCFNDPQQQLDQMQQMTDLADALNELNQRSAELQFTIDSLRAIVAKHDTAVYRMANVTGVPYVRTP